MPSFRNENPAFTLLDRLTIMWEEYDNAVDCEIVASLLDDVKECMEVGRTAEEITEGLNILGNGKAHLPNWHIFYGVMSEVITKAFFEGNANLN